MPQEPDMQQVIAEMRLLPNEVRKEIRPALKKAGDAVVQDARQRASWSSRIPGAISARVRFGQRRTGVIVQARARAAPHARPYEGLGQPGTFRHPTWGTDPWVSQARRPFLAPAVQAKRGEAQRAIAEVMETAARKVGFR